MPALLLYAISFVTNAAILIFEIAGGRLLAPYLGTSVGVWAGIIAVVLGGMALGYRIGGIIADKYSSRIVIGQLLFAAAAAALVTWGVRDWVPTVISSLGVSTTFGAVLVAFVLFLPTVMILAATSPMLAKNLIVRLDRTAHVVGMLNAVGTVGSILGAITTGAFLVPYFGIDVILLSVSVGLFILSLIVLQKDAAKLLMALIVILVVALLFNALPTRAERALSDTATAYNRIFVDERSYGGKPARSLSMSPFHLQCAMFITEDGGIDESRLVFTYPQAHELILNDLYPAGVDRMLVLGGCVYSFPRYILEKQPDMVLDVVEIDEGMTTVAEKYFGFVPEAFPTLSLFYEDARVFLNEDHDAYDVVIMDVFGAEPSVPFHLTTQEMFERVSVHLKEDGVLIINIIGAPEGEHARFVAAEMATAKSVFPHVALYQFMDAPTVNQNLALLASRSRTFPDTIRGEKLLLTQIDSEEGSVLYDNFAPVERLIGI